MKQALAAAHYRRQVVLWCCSHPDSRWGHGTARCNATHMSGCKASPAKVTVGPGPSWTTINLALHTFYEVDQQANYDGVLNNK